MENKQRGGARQGAGRKPGPQRRMASFKIKPELLERLKAIAAQRGTSQASLIEGWIQRLK
jgi:hypothetical protein